MSLEKKLKELASCGIVLNKDLPLPAAWETRSKERDPDDYLWLLIELGSQDIPAFKLKKWYCDQLLYLDLEWLCLPDQGTFRAVMGDFSRLSRGQLNFENVEETLNEEGVLQVSFSLKGNPYHLFPPKGADWLDMRFVKRLAFFLDQQNPDLHYYNLYLQGQIILIGCFTEDEIKKLQGLTGLPWTKITPAEPERPRPVPNKLVVKKTRKKPVKKTPRKKINYRELWAKPFNDEPEFVEYLKKIAKQDVFLHWKRMNEAAVAQGEFRHGLEILLGCKDKLDPKIFFQRAIALVDRAARSPGRNQDRPWAKGKNLRTKCYAQALMGKPFDATLLVKASRILEEWTVGQNYWDEFNQMYFRAAIRASLIAGDWERAKRLLKKCKKFRANPREFFLLKLLVHSLPPPFTKGKLRDRFQSYFDRIRNPRYIPSAFVEDKILAFEFSALWCKYFASSDGTINWKQVIETIVS